MNRALSAMSFAIIGGVGVLLAPNLRGQYEEGEHRPSPCPQSAFFGGYIDGSWFVGVHQLRDSVYSTNVAHYVNTNYHVVSANKKWLWVDGGGTFTCHEQWLVYFWLQYNTLVDADGLPLLPIKEPEELPPPPPPQGGGTYDHDHPSTDTEICTYQYSYNTETGAIYWIRLLYCYS